MAKLMCPETDEPLTLGRVVEPEYTPASNAVESVLNGANEGLKMVMGITASLIAFIGLVSLVNLILTKFGSVPNHFLPVQIDWTIQGLLGYVYYPFIVMTGVPLADATEVAKLVADRLVLTEVSSYFALQALIKDGALQARSVLTVSYVLCGFAHVASLAIFIGGAAALAPKRLPELSRIGFRALIAANLACLMTGNIAGLFYHSALPILAVQ
jgi:CNT family concentrative nucleoside transporter